MRSMVDWKIYVNDYGMVTCYEPGGTDDCEDAFCLPIGRRGTVAQYLQEIRDHAKRAHGIDLD